MARYRGKSNSHRGREREREKYDVAALLSSILTPRDSIDNHRMRWMISRALQSVVPKLCASCTDHLLGGKPKNKVKTNFTSSVKQSTPEFSANQRPTARSTVCKTAVETMYHAHLLAFGLTLPGVLLVLLVKDGHVSRALGGLFLQGLAVRLQLGCHLPGIT